ncbi:MAG: D-sedoheptulose 7-phosphate isomerase [Rhodospirillales bacterium]
MSAFDSDRLFAAGFGEHLEVAARTRVALGADFARLVEAALTAIGQGGKILFFGNGGSASDAQHLATELTIRYLTDRPAIAALALTTDSSTLTAAGNDLGFEQIFSRQIEALGRPGDLALGISTSGNSPNVLKALAVARERGLTTAGFSGRNGGRMAEVCDILLVVPSQDTPHIQEMHILLGHLLCAGVEQGLGLVEMA